MSLICLLTVVMVGVSTEMIENDVISYEDVKILPDRPQPYINQPHVYGDVVPVDLHNKEFCVDLSTYQPLVWEEMEGEECHTNFVKECGDKTEEVCANVTETRCEVIPYTECSMGLESQDFSETKLAPKKLVEKACTRGTKMVPHQKLLPECRNVTKQNCVTLWETDANGNQVWAGNDACEPVTWQECKLVPKDVQFIVPEITCSDKQELWYHEPEEKTDTRMTNTFGCEAKSSTHCTEGIREDCKNITYSECREVPVTDCQPKTVHIPTQELLHRKKCLLPDAKPNPSYGFSSPVEAPLVVGAPAPEY